MELSQLSECVSIRLIFLLLPLPATKVVLYTIKRNQSDEAGASDVPIASRNVVYIKAIRFAAERLPLHVIATVRRVGVTILYAHCTSTKTNLNKLQHSSLAKGSPRWLAEEVQAGPTEASRATCTFAAGRAEGGADGSLEAGQEEEGKQATAEREWCSRLKTEGLPVRPASLRRLPF